MCEDGCRRIETTLVRGASRGDSKTGAVSFPIYQSSTFSHPGLNETTGYDYARLQNPTREEVEKTVALLENGVGAVAFSSGLSAVDACIHLFESGDHVILSEDLYGGTFRLFKDIYSKYGIESTFVDTSDLEVVEKSIQQNTKAIFIETPSNPLMRITDIKGIVEICNNNNLISIVDNTFLTPYFQKPLELGANIVVHSGTKYLGGHNDVLAGFVVTSKEEILEEIRYIQKSTGSCLAPIDAWLILRGLKTLHIRMDRSEKNATKIARWLERHKKIEEVYYSGLEIHPGYEINLKQSLGFGSMISFRVKDKADVEKLLGELKVISFAESLGGVETLITYPYTQTHAEMPEEVKKHLGVDEYLLRLSVGIECVDDLIKDIKTVLEDRIWE